LIPGVLSGLKYPAAELRGFFHVSGKCGGYFGCRTLNVSAATALFSFSSNDVKPTAAALPEDLSRPAADR